MTGENKYEHCVDPLLQPDVLSAAREGDGERLYPVIVSTEDRCNANQLSELCPMGESDEPGKSMRHVKMFTGRLSIATIKKLAQHPDVKMISLDREVKGLLNVATPAIDATAVRNQYNLTGAGVGIAILDTGVYPHPDLIQPSNRIVAFRDFIQGRTNPYDDNGHGTHVAGCAASNGFSSSGLYRGPAPEANIIGVKVLNAQGGGSFSSVISGIDYCIENQAAFNIRIMNLSLGAVPFTSYIQDPLAEACRRAWRAGIVVCAAAGNTGPNGTINTPGFDPLVITVGAINDVGTTSRSDDQYAEYTSRGPTVNGFIKPDIAAPGSNITSLLAPNSTLAQQFPGNIVGKQYFILSGTSMSTPLCAGACAQILQAYPTYTPDRVKALIKESAQFFRQNTPGYLLVSRAIQVTIV
jgi:serine protease AprX